MGGACACTGWVRHAGGSRQTFALLEWHGGLGAGGGGATCGPEAWRAAAAAATAAAARGDEEELDDADDAGEVSSSKTTRRQHLAACLVGEKEEEPGALAIVQVRAIYARAPKKGFLMKDAADPSIDDGSQLKVERLQFDASTGQLRPMAVGLRFGRISAAEVHCVLHPNPTAQPGVLELPAAEQLALDASIDGLRAAAVETIRECRLARARAKQQKDDLRRIQGRDDIERLAVPLMQEELRARRARGEEIEVTLTSRRDGPAPCPGRRPCGKPGHPGRCSHPRGGGLAKWAGAQLLAFRCIREWPHPFSV